jgi:hypothetical protein
VAAATEVEKSLEISNLDVIQSQPSGWTLVNTGLQSGDHRDARQ